MRGGNGSGADFFFTKSLKYCIISISGTAVGIAGFFILVGQADRILKKGKGKAMFFMTGLAKLLVMTGMVFVISRSAGAGVLFFLQGWMTVYVGIAGAGLRRVSGGKRHGT